MLIFIILNKKRVIEKYDDRYINIDLKDCANFCKKTSNCYGFGYNLKDKTCYPSQYPISGWPLYSLYKDEYSYYNITCNKINAILNPNPFPSFEERRSNSIYVCSESKDKQPQYYFFNKNNFLNIGEGRNIDDIFDVEEYEIYPYSWPRNKFNCDQLDLLKKEQENQTFTPQNVTDLNRIIKYSLASAESEKIPLLSKNGVNDEKKFYFNLNGIKNGWEKKALGLNNIKEEFTENNNLNQGEFLRNYKCVKNIPLNDCLKYCFKNKICKGTEWNPLFYNNFDICCPYRTVGNFIKRDESKSLGKFYLK